MIEGASYGKVAHTYRRDTGKYRKSLRRKSFCSCHPSQGRSDVPAGVCICTEAYGAYVDRTGLRGRILLELSRKPFGEMRWEELWGISEKMDLYGAEKARMKKFRIS
ncbi:hypothetical protein [Methanosarcina siciliae]|uniref:hypothetical protein n=1 Tax=Methanosarcina siciliae TaxID=38027 RepID=UPI000A78AA0D|nr:hypothetical protein [Methanosarcina siciliae]